MAWPHAFHNHPIMTGVWFLTYAVCVVPEIILSKRLRSGEDAQKADRGSMIVVILAANLGMVLAFVAATALRGFSIGMHWRETFIAGIIIWIGGAAFRWYAIRTLGSFFTFDVAISRGQQVVERGPYRWLRHPSYLGGLLGALGFGMTLTNWLALPLPVCCLASAYVYRIRVEEQALVRGLGSGYSEYMKRTWRLIPYVF